MEQRSGRGLNGWQRLWIAIAVIGLVPVAWIVLSGWESGDTWIHDLARQAPARVQIEGVGEMEFPAAMSQEAIALVTRASGGDAEAIRAGIRVWSNEFNSVIRTHVANLDRLLVMRALAYWFAGVVMLYLFGWLTGWVLRGFRT